MSHEEELRFQYRPPLRLTLRYNLALYGLHFSTRLGPPAVKCELLRTAGTRSRDLWHITRNEAATMLQGQYQKGTERMIKAKKIYIHIFVNIRNIYEVIEVFFPPTNAQVIVLKTILKFTLKQLRHVSVRSSHLQGVHYPYLLKLHFVKTVNYGVWLKSVVMWLHILVVSLLMCVCRTVRE